jgi:hypothetical protein
MERLKEIQQKRTLADMEANTKEEMRKFSSPVQVE